MDLRKICIPNTASLNFDIVQGQSFGGLTYFLSFMPYLKGLDIHWYKIPF